MSTESQTLDWERKHTIGNWIQSIIHDKFPVTPSIDKALHSHSEAQKAQEEAMYPIHANYL